MPRSEQDAHTPSSAMCGRKCPLDAETRAEIRKKHGCWQGYREQDTSPVTKDTRQIPETTQQSEEVTTNSFFTEEPVGQVPEPTPVEAFTIDEVLIKAAPTTTTEHCQMVVLRESIAEPQCIIFNSSHNHGRWWKRANAYVNRPS